MEALLKVLQEILKEMQVHTVLLAKVTEELKAQNEMREARAAFPESTARAINDAIKSLEGSPFQPLLRAAAEAGGVVPPPSPQGTASVRSGGARPMPSSKRGGE